MELFTAIPFPYCWWYQPALPYPGMDDQPAVRRAEYHCHRYPVVDRTLHSYPIITNDKLLIAIFGGFFLGMGIGT